ncbi:MAG TPA: methyltransferase domain-containing protein [Kofleriaceae bacterium]|nr:methyltransferase domain-containing protein [Polyangiaceae bacterium]
MSDTDYFANHERARRFPWTLYHAPLERDLANFLAAVRGHVLVVGCGLLHEIDRAPEGLRFTVADVDARAVEAVLARDDPRIEGGFVVPPEAAIETPRRFDAIYAKEVVEHVLAWPVWLAGLRRLLVPGGKLWLSTPNYGEPWLPAIESTVLELVARRSGFSRRDIHPTRFSRRSLARALVEAGFSDVRARVIPTRLAITAWATAA